MPGIASQVVVRTAGDAARSAAWYSDLPGIPQAGRYAGPDEHVGLVQLGDPGSGVRLCLVDHGEPPGTFSEFRAGLDHLEFLVSRRSELDGWAARLDERGIPRSGI